MRHLFPLTISLLGASLVAQQPVNEHAPQPGTSQSSPDALIDCTTVAAPFDVTGAVGDIRVLGVANVNDTRMGGTGVSKWFFSGAAGGAGAQQIYIFDSDGANYPIATGFRQMGAASSLISPFWGHRDGEGYTYVDLAGGGTAKAIALFGDEGDNITWIDATTEMWSTTVINHGSATIGTSRAIAVRRDEQASMVPGLNTEKIKLYTSDFSSGFEVWNLDLAAGTAVQDTSNPPLNSPPATYGATVVERPTAMGPLWYLAVHHQSQNTCPGTGQVKVTVIDINPGPNYGMTVWERSLDINVVGGGSNTAGGIAGGLDLTEVNGQPAFAGLQQASNDTCGFVGLSVVQGLPGPLDCGPETLIMDTDGTVLDVQLLNRNASLLYAVGLGFPPPAGAPLPFNPACTLDLTVPVPAFFLLPPGVSFPPISVPSGFSIDFVADAGAFSMPITSTNRVDIKVCEPAPF